MDEREIVRVSRVGEEADGPKREVWYYLPFGIGISGIALELDDYVEALLNGSILVIADSSPDAEQPERQAEVLGFAWSVLVDNRQVTGELPPVKASRT